MIESIIIGFVIAKTESRKMSNNKQLVKWIMVQLNGMQPWKCFQQNLMTQKYAHNKRLNVKVEYKTSIKPIHFFKCLSIRDKYLKKMYQIKYISLG